MKAIINVLFYVAFAALLATNLYLQRTANKQSDLISRTVPVLQICEQSLKDLGMCQIQLMACGCEMPPEPIEEQTNGEGQEI